MTQGTVPEVVSKYHFQCFCGAPVVTTDKTATACDNCGKAFGIRRARRHTRRRRHIASRMRPHRKLKLEDLEELAFRMALYLLSGCYVYDLLHG
jgi:hypothetical protein